ncbi:RNA polymerase sigma factor SigJ [Dactylosporangium sp. NPDC051485]|uniref:RNA polymerase sigma factor SigJ n=1 Tax=Dactylosporangium sp. NPDC051485 TaxID=3154846 RepID=UPI0034256738
MSEPIDERRQLINLAYRLLGSLADAEDVVQEAFARWYTLTPGQRADIASPGAWLTTVTGRICLDVLGSARARRERYVGEWLPEPLPGPGAADPADRVTLDESVSMAFLVVLESMTPAERVAFVLHDVFKYSFTEVAAIVGRTPTACRKLASVARRRVEAPRAAALPAAEQAALVRDFRQAWEAGDIEALVWLLDPDAVGTVDGGGLVNALPRPIVGAARLARFAVEFAAWVPAMTLRERTVNGQPGLVAERDGEIVAVIAFAVSHGRINRLWAVRNPEKLRAWTPSGADRSLRAA